MNRTPVTSSSLASIGYDPETNTLEIAFRNGRCHQYFAVPQHVAEALMASDSKGSYFARQIRDRFPSSRVS